MMAMLDSGKNRGYIAVIFRFYNYRYATLLTMLNLSCLSTEQTTIETNRLSLMERTVLVRRTTKITQQVRP